MVLYFYGKGIWVYINMYELYIYIYWGNNNKPIKKHLNIY
jgi:hypothetical protein